MDFWRGPAYSAFFDFLDSKGGFYYEVRSTFPFLPWPWLDWIVVADLWWLVDTALGRRASTQHRGSAISAAHAAALLRGDRIRAQPVHALPSRGGHVGARALLVRPAA